MHALITLAACAAISYIITETAKRAGVPAVVGLILAGIFIGSPLFAPLIIGPNEAMVSSAGNLAFIFLMLIAGFEVSWAMMYRERKDAVMTAVFAMVVPFLLGFSVFYIAGFGLPASLTIGICMGITAEATKAKVLLDAKKLKSRLGSMMMGAGIIDDVIGIFLFSIVCVLFSGAFAEREVLFLVSGIASFFLGIGLHKFIGRDHKRIKAVESMMMVLIVPFFFIAVGMGFSLDSILLNIPLSIVMILLAVTGKIAGCLATKPFAKLKLRQLYLVGWGMNSRGAVELALAYVAFSAGILTQAVYSSLVVMALATTLAFPFFFRRELKRHPGIMDG